MNENPTGAGLRISMWLVKVALLATVLSFLPTLWGDRVNGVPDDPRSETPLVRVSQWWSALVWAAIGLGAAMWPVYGWPIITLPAAFLLFRRFAAARGVSSRIRDAVAYVREFTRVNRPVAFTFYGLIVGGALASLILFSAAPDKAFVGGLIQGAATLVFAIVLGVSYARAELRDWGLLQRVIAPLAKVVRVSESDLLNVFQVQPRNDGSVITTPAPPEALLDPAGLEQRLAVLMPHLEVAELSTEGLVLIPVSQQTQSRRALLASTGGMLSGFSTDAVNVGEVPARVDGAAPGEQQGPTSIRITAADLGI